VGDASPRPPSGSATGILISSRQSRRGFAEGPRDVTNHSCQRWLTGSKRLVIYVCRIADLLPNLNTKRNMEIGEYKNLLTKDRTFYNEHNIIHLCAIASAWSQEQKSN